MEKIELTVKFRAQTGKGSAKAVRRSGGVPAILYGHGMKPVSLEVNARELLHALHTKAGENVLIHLKSEGLELKESTCLIKEIQHHPVTDEIAHVDFNVISLTEKVQVKVDVVVKHAEDSPGLKGGGVLDVVHHELEIECLPTEIPEKIEIDAGRMEINDTIHLKDLNMPQGVMLKGYDPEEVIVAIHPPRKEEEAESVEEEAPQPELIEKGKKAEEGEPAESKETEKKE